MIPCQFAVQVSSPTSRRASAYQCGARPSLMLVFSGNLTLKLYFKPCPRAPLTPLTLFCDLRNVKDCLSPCTLLRLYIPALTSDPSLTSDVGIGPIPVAALSPCLSLPSRSRHCCMSVNWSPSRSNVVPPPPSACRPHVGHIKGPSCS